VRKIAFRKVEIDGQPGPVISVAEMPRRGLLVVRAEASASMDEIRSLMTMVCALSKEVGIPGVVLAGGTEIELWEVDE
jgi:hypothetical protein